jgi:murein DD-endopeptidase MepM/ murein hydrolase activator NlpD
MLLFGMRLLKPAKSSGSTSSDRIFMLRNRKAGEASRGFVLLLLASGLLLASCGRQASERPPVAHGADISLVPDTITVKDLVPPRATLATLLRDLQLRPDVVQTVLDKTRQVFDARRLHAGNAYEMVRTIDGFVRHFQYEIDLDNYLRVAAVPGEEATTVKAEILPYRKQRRLLSLQGQISREAPSLFAAMEEAGETPDLSLALADVFSGEVDFNTDLQTGDSFRVAVDRIYREGEAVSYGPIIAAEFDNAGRRLRAILFTPPGGKPGYYDEQGRSLRRFFLASPLKFTLHVTSRFSRARFHPILKIYRPHLGVDYGAPTGAPVIAVAGGVVLSAGWGGQGGRVVHLRHASGYETYYMHLSSIAVRAGQHVGQGQLIGRVGMSGLATGPHLDYRIKKGGVFVNPQQVHRSLPPGEPIPASAMAQFATERDAALAKLAPPPAAGQPASAK